jgi:large subunit ribosomal protein L10
MDRTQKEAAVAELTEDLKGAEAIFAVDYRGISVTEAAELRARLREADAVFKVVKNRLAKRAAADAGTAGLDEFFIGPTALTLIHGDAVIAAKAIADFAKVNDELEYKGGFMDGEALDPDGFKVIARLPGLDVLRGQLTGLAASPITGLVRGLGSMISGLAVALGQIAEQGLVSGEPPAEEPAAEEDAGSDPDEDAGSDPDEAEAPDSADAGSDPDEAEAPDSDELEGSDPTGSDESAPPAEHAEEEAQPEEPDEAPAEEPPGEGETSDAETSNDDEQEQEEPSGDESDN